MGSDTTFQPAEPTLSDRQSGGLGSAGFSALAITAFGLTTYYQEPLASAVSSVDLSNATFAGVSLEPLSAIQNAIGPQTPRGYRQLKNSLVVVGSCFLFVVGCCLLVVGCWLLVSGCWLLGESSSVVPDPLPRGRERHHLLACPATPSAATPHARGFQPLCVQCEGGREEATHSAWDSRL